MSDNETPKVWQLQRDLWEMRKGYKTDQLAWEQDMLNANRRIEELEGRMSGMCELQQIQDGKNGEIFQRIVTLEKRYPPLTTVEARIKEIEKRMEERSEDREKPTMNWRLNAIDHRDMTERMDKLENAVASLKLLVPPPQPPCPQEEEPVDHCACFVGSEYPCQDKSEKVQDGKCIYCNTDGTCSRKRKRAHAVEPCSHKTPDTGAHYDAAHAQMRIEDRVKALSILNDILDICKATRQRVIDSEEVITDWCVKILGEMHDIPKQVREDFKHYTCFKTEERK
jgi:hypothetical protein